MAKTKPNNDKGWQITAYIAIAVIVVSLLVIGMRLTGYVVESRGVVNVSIDRTAAINFTTDFINFGNGSVSAGSSSAILESNNTVAIEGGWNWTIPQNFTLVNIGNADVKLDLMTNKDAAAFIGGTSPEYQYSISDAESGSCGTSIIFDQWYTVNTVSPGDTVCTSFSFADAHDLIQINVRLVIPSDSSTGNFTDTFTATATAL